MSQTVDWTKPIELEDGKPCRVLCTNVKGAKYNTIVLIDYGAREYPESCSEDGFTGSGINVRNKKVKKQAWVNIYPGGLACFYKSKDEADLHASSGRVVCTKVEWEE